MDKFLLDTDIEILYFTVYLWNGIQDVSDDVTQGKKRIYFQLKGLDIPVFVVIKCGSTEFF